MSRPAKVVWRGMEPRVHAVWAGLVYTEKAVLTVLASEQKTSRTQAGWNQRLFVSRTASPFFATARGSLMSRIYLSKDERRCQSRTVIGKAEATSRGIIEDALYHSLSKSSLDSRLSSSTIDSLPGAPNSSAKMRPGSTTIAASEPASMASHSYASASASASLPPLGD